MNPTSEELLTGWDFFRWLSAPDEPLWLLKSCSSFSSIVKVCEKSAKDPVKLKRKVCDNLRRSLDKLLRLGGGAWPSDVATEFSVVDGDVVTISNEEEEMDESGDTLDMLNDSKLFRFCGF